jgi:inner membrane protein
MDPVSQAALGGAWAQPAARGPGVVAATALGCLAGMAPDLDILIRSGSDPLLALEYHRQFTHSLAFIPFGALICAIAFYGFVRQRVSKLQCYLFCLLGYASHGLLDACTTYGTQLFWPLSDQRIAWNNVSVIDPLFTLPLIVLVLLGALRRRPAFAVAGLSWAILYLTFGIVQGQRATVAGRDLAASRGHMTTRLEAKPAFASIMLWKVIYEYDGRYYVDAIRTGLSTRIFEGESVEKLDLARHFPWLAAASQQARDVERFRWFSDDFLALDQSRPDHIIDMRYSLVPNRADALWAIGLDASAGSEAHVRYDTMRSRSMAEGRQLLMMMFGG